MACLRGYRQDKCRLFSHGTQHFVGDDPSAPTPRIQQRDLHDPRTLSCERKPSQAYDANHYPEQPPSHYLAVRSRYGYGGLPIDPLRGGHLCSTVDGQLSLFSAVAKRYPHCLAKLLAPADYAPIVLSGIVQHQDSAVTTELEVGFQFHLPYQTTGGNTSSLLVATGPHVSVNTIIGLPFIKATGMILDFIDDVAECKHLDCPPFNINYRRTSNHVPVPPPSPEVPIHHLGPHKKSVLEELTNLERWINAKVMASYSSAQSPSVHFGSKPAERAYTPDLASVITDATPARVNTRWVPPSFMPPHDLIDDLHHTILREDGYL